MVATAPVMDYRTFLETKTQLAPSVGVDVPA